MFWMTAQEIADELRMSRSKIYQLMELPESKGGIPHYKIGNSKNATKRVDRTQFEKWLEGRKVQ